MKVVIAHPNKQHSFRLAKAIKEAGHDVTYITTFYNRPYSLTWLAAKVLQNNNGERARASRIPGISDDEVKQYCELKGLVRRLLVAQGHSSSRLYANLLRSLNKKFGVKAAKYACRIGADVFIGFDTTSLESFELLRQIAPQVIRVLDCSSASSGCMKNIYEKDLQKRPEFADKLHSEIKEILSMEHQKRTKKERESAHYFLVPSDFVIKSLSVDGIDLTKMLYCPYDVDTSLFCSKQYKSRIATDPVRFVFLGGTKELKGLSYMLEAFQLLDHDKATLSIIGQDSLSSDMKMRFAKDVIFTGPVLHGEVPIELRKNDVFVFPSLGEGFGLSILEAMGCGLPIIVSENTGLASFLGRSGAGFVVPIQDTESLAATMQWFVDNPEMIASMGRSSAYLARTFSWNNYFNSVKRALAVIADAN